MLTKNETNIIPISDQNEIKRYISLTKNIVDSSSNLSSSFVQMKKWLVIPVESSYHFEEKDIKLLCNAISIIGITKLVAIATESLTDTPLCYEVSPTRDGLTAFNKACCHFNYLLTTENIDFIILCTTEDHYLVAGSLAFVNKATGNNLEASRKNFYKFAYQSMPDSVRDYLLSVAERYQHFNG